MRKLNLPDWAERALKTFVQTFFGVLIPAVVALLSNGFPESLSAAWVILSPVVSAALAAAIAAVWNVILERLDEKELARQCDDDELGGMGMTD